MLLCGFAHDLRKWYTFAGTASRLSTYLTTGPVHLVRSPGSRTTMNVSEIFKQTFATLRAHKLRSFLTMFGIVWGIASVILLVGLGKGFAKQQRENWKALGTDLVILWGGRTSAQAGGLAAGREIPLVGDDARLIKAECYRVKRVSPELSRSLPQTSAFNSANLQVTGIWP